MTAYISGHCITQHGVVTTNVLRCMSAQDKICSENDMALVEIYTVVLHFGLDTCQIKLGVNSKSGKCQVCQLLLFH